MKHNVIHDLSIDYNQMKRFNKFCWNLDFRTYMTPITSKQLIFNTIPSIFNINFTILKFVYPS